jgi:MFS family permease
VLRGANVTVATSSQASTVPTSSGDARVSLSSWLGLAALMIVLMYSMVDRQIFTLLAEAIRKDMALSDTQLGLLQGVGLALVGVATTYPIAWLADRFDRRLVAVGCVVSWSAAVMLCGLAPNFPWLLIGASVVGVGEAGVTPIGYAMIADLFPESKRQLANSVLAIGSRLSASAAAAIAGMTILGANILRPVLPHTLANLSQWRLGFLVTALFLPIAVLLLLTLPRRVSGLAKKTGDGSLKLSRQKAPAAPVLSFLRRNARAQFGFFIGIAVATFGFACVGIWVPVIAARDYHQTPAAAGDMDGLHVLDLGNPRIRAWQPGSGMVTPAIRCPPPHDGAGCGDFPRRALLDLDRVRDQCQPTLRVLGRAGGIADDLHDGRADRIAKHVAAASAIALVCASWTLRHGGGRSEPGSRWIGVGSPARVAACPC